MTDERKQQIALMRYAAIAPLLLTGQMDDYPTNQAFFDTASMKGSMMQDRHIQHFSPAMIERWYLNYKLAS